MSASGRHRTPSSRRTGAKIHSRIRPSTRTKTHSSVGWPRFRIIKTSCWGSSAVGTLGSNRCCRCGWGDVYVEGGGSMALSPPATDSSAYVEAGTMRSLSPWMRSNEFRMRWRTRLSLSPPPVRSSWCSGYNTSFNKLGSGALHLERQIHGASDGAGAVYGSRGNHD